jgi:hypothetical protein
MAHLRIQEHNKSYTHPYIQRSDRPPAHFVSDSSRSTFRNWGHIVSTSERFATLKHSFGELLHYIISHSDCQVSISLRPIRTRRETITPLVEVPSTQLLYTIKLIIYSHLLSQHVSVCRIWGSHSGGYEDCYLLVYSALQPVESQPVFRMYISPPSSGSKNTSSRKLAMKAICSSETSVHFQQTRRRYIPEDRSLHVSVFGPSSG